MPQRLRFPTLVALYVSQAVPLGFFTVALPAILRQQGASLEKVGLLSALALPWLLKFLWAPLVDRYGSVRHGHYRSWILPLQSLSVLCVLAIAAGEPASGTGVLIAAGAAFMLLAATQDVATDGLAVRILSPEERGPGNGIQVGGYYLGQILGGGVLLLVFGRLGWTPAILAMALVLALPLLPAAALREPRPDEERARRLEFGALGRFFLRPGQAAWVVVLVLYRTGEAMVITMVNPMLVDQGYSLERIGLLLGVAGSLASFGGATLGGLLIQHLGRKPSLVLFGLLESLAITGFLVPASGRGGEAAVYVAAVTLALAGGMGTTALYTIMMDRCARRSGATDFTLQQSLAAMGPILAASLSGVSAAALGYGRHFAVAAVVNLLLVTAAARWLAVPDPEMAASGGD